MLFARDTLRILAYGKRIDVRKSFNGLVALVQATLREDPLSGVLFVFMNRRGTYLRGLSWIAPASVCSPSGSSTAGSFFPVTLRAVGEPQGRSGLHQARFLGLWPN